jgi:aminodeoxyfutalosine synthase
MEMISEVEAQAILDGRDLIAIGVRGDEVRRRLHGAKTTFVRVFEIHVEAPPCALPPRTSAGEFRIVGTPKSVDAAIGSIRAALALAGGVPLTGFSLADLLSLEGAASLADACRALHDAGLEAVAEAPIDVLPDPAAAIAAARAAGLEVARLTVHLLGPDNRVAILMRARDLQRAVGGIRAFAPLPRAMSATAPSTGYDDVKQVALARLAVDNIESIQVDWALYGPKLAQFALTIGADDVDNVSAVDPGTFGTRRSPLEEIRGNIRSAALEAVERNGRYEAMG